MKQQTGARFKVAEYLNPKGTTSFRVAGIKRNGTRVRENYQHAASAQVRQIELEMEWLVRQSPTVVRATALSDAQIKTAEAAFARLDTTEELASAVDAWLRYGRAQSVTQSVHLDKAVDQFFAWMDSPEGRSELRAPSRKNLRVRVNVFRNSVGNVLVSHLTTEIIEQYLERRKVALKIAEVRCISRFCSWCIQRPRRWLASNPCREIKLPSPEHPTPGILTVEQCEKLLRTAETFKAGKLIPYLAVTMFAGLRPSEASRLTWAQINLEDGELRLEGKQTKTGRPRVVTMHPTLKAWLAAGQGNPFFPPNWHHDFRRLVRLAGVPWVPDVLRHSAISYSFRQSGSYGLTAEQFGNSESIIKQHYQGRVSTEDARRFYALLPAPADHPASGAGPQP